MKTLEERRMMIALTKSIFFRKWSANISKTANEEMQILKLISVMTKSQRVFHKSDRIVSISLCSLEVIVEGSG